MIIAIAMGIVGGLLMKALFLKDSHIIWDVVFGVAGGLAAFYLPRYLNDDVTGALFALGVAVVIAGVLSTIYTRFVKPARPA
jgi:uncharacterized membrane protein YeaQ/YmgE (transglycosylase-associated protein family)